MVPRGTDGGLIRKIPDSGDVRCCLVGLCGIGEGVSDLGVMIYVLCVCVCLGVSVPFIGVCTCGGYVCVGVCVYIHVG